MSIALKLIAVALLFGFGTLLLKEYEKHYVQYEKEQFINKNLPFIMQSIHFSLNGEKTKEVPLYELFGHEGYKASKQKKYKREYKHLARVEDSKVDKFLMAVINKTMAFEQLNKDQQAEELRNLHKRYEFDDFEIIANKVDTVEMQRVIERVGEIVGVEES